MKLRPGTKCKYCGKPYKYGTWLNRHEFFHWWNEVATPEQKKFFIDTYNKQEDMIMFGLNAQSNTCGGISNFVRTASD